MKINTKKEVGGFMCPCDLSNSRVLNQETETKYTHKIKNNFFLRI